MSSASLSGDCNFSGRLMTLYRLLHRNPHFQKNICMHPHDESMPLCSIIIIKQTDRYFRLIFWQAVVSRKASCATLGGLKVTRELEFDLTRSRGANTTHPLAPFLIQFFISRVTSPLPTPCICMHRMSKSGFSSISVSSPCSPSTKCTHAGHRCVTAILPTRDTTVPPGGTGGQ